MDTFDCTIHINIQLIPSDRTCMGINSTTCDELQRHKQEQRNWLHSQFRDAKYIHCKIVLFSYHASN